MKILLSLFLFFLIEVGGAKNYSHANVIKIYPPELIPEREFAYLREPILNFFQSQILSTSEAGLALYSRFNFEARDRVRIYLTLVDTNTSKEVVKREAIATYDTFWNVLSKEVSILKEKLREPAKELSSQKSSILARLNPFNLISKLIPKKEDSLKIKIEVPPPPPPPSYEAKSFVHPPPPVREDLNKPTLAPQSQALGLQLQPISPSKLEPSPWQWY